jgi:hypothetical protein
VLLGHPSVRQALCFAIPHAQLGEEIGAAIELEPGAALQGSELRTWAGERLPAFKVLRLIRVLEEIPKGPTGKLQRIGLSARLGIEPIDDTLSDTVVVPPSAPTEEQIVEIWEKFFPHRSIGVRTRFEALGEDSLLAVDMLCGVSAASGVEVPSYIRFVEEGTIAALAQAIDAGHSEPGHPTPRPAAKGTLPPLYCIPGHDGTLLGLARSPLPFPISLYGPSISPEWPDPPPWKPSPRNAWHSSWLVIPLDHTGSPACASAACWRRKWPGNWRPRASEWSLSSLSTHSTPPGKVDHRFRRRRSPAWIIP